MYNEIWVSYNYGGWSLVFSKKNISLPFAPFIGLEIVIDEEKEYTISLENNSYTSTTIQWSIEKQQFSINVRNMWGHPVTDETIDSVLEVFSSWKRHDQTNIQDLKNLMNRNK